MSLGTGYRYLMESVAVGDGALGGVSNLTRYYAESGTPPGVFLGAGLSGLDDGRGVAAGTTVTEEHLFNLLGMCADPVTGTPLGRQPNCSRLSGAKRIAARVEAIAATTTETERADLVARIDAEERATTRTQRAPVAGFDLTFSLSKSVSTAWALADAETKALIYACHRRAIDVVLAYAEREVDKTHHSLAELTDGWRERAATFVGHDTAAWVATLAERNDLPALCTSDLADAILEDAAAAAVEKVAERRATFSRANVLAEVHRQLHGVRFTTPDERIAVAERTCDLAVARCLLISAPELHTTPGHLRRPDDTSRFRAKNNGVYTTTTLLEAEVRLLDAGRRVAGPAVTRATVAAITGANLPGRDHGLSLDQAFAVEQVATSGRSLDVLLGPAGTGKSTTMAGLRAVWEAEHGPGSVLGLAPSAAAAEVLAAELGIGTENTAKWCHEHRQEAERVAKITQLRQALVDPGTSLRHRSTLRSRVAQMQAEVEAWRLGAGQLVIVDEASLAGTFALDELVSAAGDVGAKVLLVGDGAQLSAVEAGGMFAALVHVRDGFVPALSDVRRFRNEWEKTASLELRVGSEDAIDAYQAHGRIEEGGREQMLDALYRAWKTDTEAGRVSLMIAGDLGTVNELNVRARADRIVAGTVAEHGVSVAGGATAGVGDRVVTRENDRTRATGRRWVRNGDQWTVTAIDTDGSTTVTRLHGAGKLRLPAAYVAEHVELAYASTAHRSQGRTVDTAHTMVLATTSREVLYVSATRGRESNRLYVDTHYDPDPETSHDAMAEPVTARHVLAGVLRREGADLAAHEMIRRDHDEAEGMERLSAEYLTLATIAQASRWDVLLARSGLTDDELAAVQASDARGPLLAAFRNAEARGLDIETALPRLVAGRSLADADDITSVLHHRVERWTNAAAGRRPARDNLIAGLIPRARGVKDPELATALAERVLAMQDRARTLAAQAVEAGRPWVTGLGNPPIGPTRRERWLREVSTVAAYRDRWHLTGQQPLGAETDVSSIEHQTQRKRAHVAIQRAVALSRAETEQPAGPVVEVELPGGRGVER